MNEGDDLILTLFQLSFIKSYKVFGEFKNNIDTWIYFRYNEEGKVRYGYFLVYFFVPKLIFLVNQIISLITCSIFSQHDR